MDGPLPETDVPYDVTQGRTNGVKGNWCESDGFLTWKVYFGNGN